jgi:hypothetical protein
MEAVLLSTTYFGPVQWYQKLHRAECVQMEQWESFQKQTYRNRCLIATTQGIQALTVPTERGGSPLIKDTRISDHGNWRHLHWNALQSAYGESPFFEYYQDDIRPFFEHRWDYLLDFNEAIRTKICDLIDIQPKVSYSLEFRTESLEFATAISSSDGTAAANSQFSILNSQLIKDFRSAIRPKHPLSDPDFELKPYYQVYQQKYGFLPNLSILDLLFNMGPESIFYL